MQFAAYKSVVITALISIIIIIIIITINNYH